MGLYAEIWIQPKRKACYCSKIALAWTASYGSICAISLEGVLDCYTTTGTVNADTSPLFQDLHLVCN